jgi:outer membrane protein OmpA-like peptidoglycan-associated protein
MRVATSVFVLAAAMMSANAFAQTTQSSEDIIKFFANAASLGASRGICVGTEDECKAKGKVPVQTGLDMLINFDLNSADLTPTARTELSEFAKALKDNRLRSHSFVVEGHTDASGSEIYNEGLSERRAQSVTAFLLASGIEPARIKAVGMGETHPRVADPYDPVNRRVEMRINLQ